MNSYWKNAIYDIMTITHSCLLFWAILYVNLTVQMFVSMPEVIARIV